MLLTDYLAIWGAVLGTVGTALSVFVYVHQRRAERGQERRDRKARLRAWLNYDETGSRGRHSLVIHNEGSGHAKSVRIEADGTPLDQHHGVVRPEKPLEQLGPGARFEYFLVSGLNRPHISHMRISWSDDSGEPGNFETQFN